MKNSKHNGQMIRSLAVGVLAFAMYSFPVEASCGYCEGYKVFEAATKKTPPPKQTEFPNERHSRIVGSAKTVIDQLIKESPSLKDEARRYFVKTLAKAAPYDSGNELVDHFWGKIQAYRKDVNAEIESLAKKKEITKAEKDTLLLNLALIEGQIEKGQD